MVFAKNIASVSHSLNILFRFRIFLLGVVVRSVSLTLLSFLFFLISSNSFATMDSKKEDQETLRHYRIVKWSSVDLTIHILSDVYPRQFYLKVKTIKELNNIIENAGLYGNFVVDKSYEDKENNIFGALISSEFPESESNAKFVIARVDSFKEIYKDIITTVNTESGEIFIWTLDYRASYYSYDRGKFKSAPKPEVGDLLKLFNIGQTEMDYYSKEEKLNIASPIFLVRRGEAIPETVTNNEIEVAANEVLTKAQAAVDKRVSIELAFEREFERTANFCEILGDNGEIKQVVKDSFVIISANEYVNSPSDIKRDIPIISEIFSKETKKALMYCHGTNVLKLLKGSFYSDLIENVLDAYKFSTSIDSIASEVFAAEQALLNLRFNEGGLMGDESVPDLNKRKTLLGGRLENSEILVFASNSDFQAIIDLYEFMQDLKN